MFIVMLGAPGSGKGTVAKLLKDILGVEHISTGDMFRETLAQGTELGKELESYMSRGALVPDEIVIRIIEEKLNNLNSDNVVLDGFPRTVEQAKFLSKMLAGRGEKIDLVLHLDLPDEEIIYRTVKRRICVNKGCEAIYNLEFTPPKVEGKCDKCGSDLMQRKDDNAETITTRLETYHVNADPIIKYFEQVNLLKSVKLSIYKNITRQDVENWIKEWKNK